jgi:hypothetical protein
MKIDINLYADWINLIIAKSESLRKQGFRIKNAKLQPFMPASAVTSS